MVQQFLNRILEGGKLSHHEALQLVNTVNKEELYQAANQIREHFTGNYIELCSIVNAKSGRCSENCKFCAQSAHYKTFIDEYEMIEPQEALAQARQNYDYGVHKFALVTSGHSVSDSLLEQYGKIYTQIRTERPNLRLCASMGFLTQEKAQKLKEFGIENYHCNIETSRSFFPNICTTHTYEEKIENIRLATQAGLKPCSGGIIGMGETMEQRIEMAIELRELNIKSIPLNILNPIAGTPLENNPLLSVEEILTSIAIFRFLNPDAYIRFAGGRLLLGEYQTKALQSGINAALVGDLLTTVGKNVKEDLEMFEEAGFQINSECKK